MFSLFCGRKEYGFVLTDAYCTQLYQETLHIMHRIHKDAKLLAIPVDNYTMLMLIPLPLNYTATHTSLQMNNDVTCIILKNVVKQSRDDKNKQ